MQPTLFALKRAYQAARNALEILLQPTGLTAAQLDVLKLVPAAGLDQRALQAELGITSATRSEPGSRDGSRNQMVGIVPPSIRYSAP